MSAVVFDPQFHDWKAPHPEIEFLWQPYLYVAQRAWIWGPQESAKSLWMQWVSAQLSREGRRVVYVQQDNSEAVEMDRWNQLTPDPGNFHLLFDQDFDLADPTHVDKLCRATTDADLVVIDTLSACWSGEENSNREIGEFNRKVLRRLQRQGCAVVVIHHTGHAQENPQTRRDAGTAGRGGIAQGNNADVTLEFRRDKRYAQGVFTIHHGKNKPGGGVRYPPQVHRVVDTPDGCLDIVLQAEPNQDVVTQAQLEALGKIRAFLEPLDNGASFDPIVKATGLGKSLVYKVLCDMAASRDLLPRKKRDPYRLRRSEAQAA